MDQTSLSILTYIGGLIGVMLIAKIFWRPFKILLKIFLNSVLGCILILIINTFSPYLHISIGLNPVTALVCGVLGVPGVILLALLQFFL